MLEDAIERSHQRRVSDEQRLIRLRSEQQIKRCQAKLQNARMIPKVSLIQEEVKNRAKRNMTNSEPLRERRDSIKRAKRVVKREDSLESAKAQDLQTTIQKPRKVLLNDLRTRLKERDEAIN